MTEYIKRSDAIMAITRAKLPDKTPEGIPIANGKRSVTDCIQRIRAIPPETVLTLDEAEAAAWSVIESLGYSSKHESGWRLVEALRGALEDAVTERYQPPERIKNDP